MSLIEKNINMKRYFILLFAITILNTACFQQHDNYGYDPALLKFFNKKDIEYLDKIVDYFDNKAKAVCENKEDISAYYKDFLFKTAHKYEEGKEIFIDTSGYTKLFNSIPKSTFDKIWNINKGYIKMSHDSPKIPKKFIDFINTGYYSFLKDYSSKNENLKEYFSLVEKTGDTGPSAVKFAFYNYNDIDFSSKTNRLVYSIHLFTLINKLLPDN